MEVMSQPTKHANAFREALIAKASPNPVNTRLRMEPFSPEDRDILLEWVKSTEYRDMLEATGMTVYDSDPLTID
jgi:hypothetical protein